ncbi:MAG: major tail protein [Eubacteriales bacterium]
MSQKKNKVKFNICNVHYAKLLSNSAEGASFETPIAMAGAVSISLSPNGEPSNFYADGYAYHTISNNTGYDGDLELALIPESFLVDILKEELDENGVLIEDSNVETENFALLFEFDGDVRKIRHVMYNCSASRPEIASQTKEETTTPEKETITIKASPLATGRVKGKTGSETTQDAYDNWYKVVYYPSGDSTAKVEPETEGE